jgi:hypothetical protein
MAFDGYIPLITSSLQDCEPQTGVGTQAAEHGGKTVNHGRQ